ncbi:MAG TPA: STAS domain-containing protein [Chloroflexota bacterium]|nr:STAS domain-containing protein [Chloroflexota bacterium]
MMNVTIEQVQGRVPVTIMKLAGQLDASCYLDVIETGKKLHQEGVRDLLIDMSEMTFMASSGLVALHNIALLMRGEQPQDPEAGWAAMHAINRDVQNSGGYESHCKLLNPTPSVRKTLDVTGFANLFEIFDGRDEAIAAFG